MSQQIKVKTIAFFCAILVLMIIILYSGLQILESTNFTNGEKTEDSFVSKTITRDGIDYFPRQDITVMMVLGIDQFGPVQASGSYLNPGAADVVLLLIFDDKNESASVLCLNRDTMVDMPVLGIGGKQAGSVNAQLALSHTYGDGLTESCENTKKAVSDFLYGLRIDYYVSMNMDAVALLTDAVGGVTVNVTDDFSNVDPTITKGEIKLQGDQALTFVRTRKDVGNQMNLSRMERHKEFMQGFLSAFRENLSEGAGFAASLYDEISPYVVTDCSVTTITDLMDRYVDYEITEIVAPEGENVLGEEHYEFYADEDALDELILRLFYAEK